MKSYDIEVERCNSIEKAKIVITKGVLNIKFGPNGLGKSTIARAIMAAIANDGSLANLKPFKYRSLADQCDPVVRGVEGIESVLVFDDSYISQFVFQHDEVLKNSFEVFIRNDDFDNRIKEIDYILERVKFTFFGNEDLSRAISDLKELQDAFVVTKAGGMSKVCKGNKAFGSGNKIKNIPDQLKPFEPFITSEQPAAWIAWQTAGNSYVDLADNCPYCATLLQEPEKKALAKQVAKEYDLKAIEHLNNLQAIISRLGRYFESDCRQILEKITVSKFELSLEEKSFLIALRSEIETLLTKFERVRTMSFFTLRDVDKVEDEIGKLKIDLNLLAKLNSTDTAFVVKQINESLDELIIRVGDLKGKINQHKKQIERAILGNQDSINRFLCFAGYKYKVMIESEADSYKMKLIHNDHEEHIGAASKHLSFGEKNAFALVLFMHQVLKERPSLVVLDDPVSSFDKTKKFAILNELFRGKRSLKNMTVLMLTHDIEPAIDITRNVKRLFQGAQPTAYFLSSRNGTVTENVINGTDFKTFAQICTENVTSPLVDKIIQCIYLRRHFEILNDLGVEYNYLANLLHAQENPTRKTVSGEIAMTAEEIDRAVVQIKSFIPSFDYHEIRSSINDKFEMRRRFQGTNIGYEKLQLFRIYKEVHLSAESEDDVFRKFINESFHIENEYVMQLNPHKFDNIPEYIVKECERIISMS